MTKVFFIGCLCSVLILIVSTSDDNEEAYDDIYEDENELDYSETDNTTDQYDDTQGRDEQLLGETRPVFPLNHYQHPGTHNYLQDLFNYQRPIRRPGLKNRRRIFGRKGYKYFIPLLLSALAKVAHFLPVVKLTLLALFALVLFSKKALLVSIGSLILVIYDTFYKKKNKGVSIVKDRGSTVPTVEHGSLPEEPPNLEEGWWAREEKRPTKLHSREDNSNNEKWKRWWAPQINFRRNIRDSPFTNNRESSGYEDYVFLNKLDTFFSNE